MLSVYPDCLVFRQCGETIKITAVSDFAIRVQGSFKEAVEGPDWSLKAKASNCSTRFVNIYGYLYVNGLTARISHYGQLSFLKESKVVLEERYRDFGYAQPHSPALKRKAREWAPHPNGGYSLRQSFEGDPDERFYGMGQYQMSYLNLAGCHLELAQRNSQVSIPFFLSSKGYGLLWNNPAVGEAYFGKDGVELKAHSTHHLDYVVIAGNSPKEILEHYTELVGRAPDFPSDLLGLWQSKLRYRTPAELNAALDGYGQRHLPLSMLVIDFFHWTKQGEWEFDPKYWANIGETIAKAHQQGVNLMVSIWPTVEKRSKYYKDLLDSGCLLTPIKGTQSYDYNGDCLIIDFTSDLAKEFVFNKANKSYGSIGIDYYWLDQAEPEFTSYDFDNHIYSIGPSLEVANVYPVHYLKAFANHAPKGKKLCLIRSSWFGAQEQGALLWSGDVPSTFASLRDQFAASLNVGIAGQAWWTSDIGGFYGDVNDNVFKELLVRWFEWSVFSPVLRMHGNRAPYDSLPLDDRDVGGGFAPTGRPNELWSFGDDVYSILKENLSLRESLKPYIASLFKQASEFGYPLMRPLFLEFPEDPKAWANEDQYMFGPKYLVAPVFDFGVRERRVYLPSGTWSNLHDGKTFVGPVEIKVSCPLNRIGVFEKID